MKRKTFFRIVLLLIILEVLVIVGMKGYEIIKNAAVSSTLNPSKNTVPIKQHHTVITKPGESNGSSKDIVSSPSDVDKTDSEPEWGVVDSDYFKDALFIGDSRTVALKASGVFPDSTFFARTGIGIHSLFEYPTTDESSGMYLSSVLSQKTYGKIYLMIGVNDLSYGTISDFSDYYFSVIDKIREYQPIALIYVQSIVGITAGKELNSPHNFNNQTVINRNALLKAKCDEKSVFYLDLFSVYSDGRGYLNREYSTDGLHIKHGYHYLWEDFLKHNAVIRAKE